MFRSARHPDYWEYNCIRLDRPMQAGEMIAAADWELGGCAHRWVEWMTPMPDGVVDELRDIWHREDFGEVETHDGGSEVTQVIVRPERRGAGLGGALTVWAIRAGAEAARDVWICAERDDRPRRLYEQLGFRVVLETGVGILPPKP